MSTEKCDKTSSRQACNQNTKRSQEEKEAHEQQRIEAAMAQVKYKFMVLSGKGGVGKSSVAVNLAVTLAREGFDVGILDADIHGPNIPKMMGVEEKRLVGSQDGLMPIPTESGVKVISIAFLLRSKDDAVIWRGPLIGKTITQFGEEVLWGKLDYLIIDLPPGTADAPLTVMQSFTISGVIVVFTPQDLTEMIVMKAVKMASKMHVRVLAFRVN